MEYSFLEKGKKMVEPLLMVAIASSSVLFPVIVNMTKNEYGCLSVTMCVIFSVMLSHCIFYIVNPIYHYGPTTGMGIVMELFISSAIVLIVVGIMTPKKES